MYHYISSPPADADIYRTDLSTPPEQFRRQMAYLAENGYTPIDLYQLSAAIAAKIDLPEKPVVLTFDDGYRDNYENAFPVLQEYGFTATFFIIADYADQGAEGYMDWTQLEEMAAAGMRIESHSKNHPDLRGKSRDFHVFQMLGSQQTIASHVGYTPRYFSYPGGFYDQTSIDILRELDFWGAVTTQGGAWHGYGERYEWTRQRLRNDTTMEEFGWLVDLGGTVGGKNED
jgi:peptidoglycan/xylan/chitin deacetylase (PgdA/CDA1 family)